MKRHIISFYSRHPILSVNICALFLWIFINISGAFVLHMFGRNKLDDLIGDILILSYILIFTIALGMKAFYFYKNRNGWKRIIWLIYFIFQLFIFLVCCTSIVNKLSII